MLFNSLSFLAFFAVLAVVYYAMPHRFRWPLLLVASLYFYAAFSARYLLLLIGITLIAYLGGLAMGASAGRRPRRLIWPLALSW